MRIVRIYELPYLPNCTFKELTITYWIVYMDYNGYKGLFIQYLSPVRKRLHYYYIILTVFHYRDREKRMGFYINNLSSPLHSVGSSYSLIYR